MAQKTACNSRSLASGAPALKFLNSVLRLSDDHFLLPEGTTARVSLALGNLAQAASGLLCPA